MWGELSGYIITPDGELCRCDELYHYGVKGMKWGVRRKRNNVSNSSREARKAEKKEFKRDLKTYRKSKNVYDVDIKYDGTLTNVRNRGDEFLSRTKAKKGKQYVDRLIKSDKRRDRLTYAAALGSSALMTAGYAYISAKYS